MFIKRVCLYRFVTKFLFNESNVSELDGRLGMTGKALNMELH